MADFNAPRITLRLGAAMASIWLALLLVLVILMVTAFIHLDRPPVPAELRSSNPRTSWVPAPRYSEHAFAKLEVTEGRP